MAISEWKIFRDQVTRHEKQVILCDDDPNFREAFQETLSCLFTKLNIRASILCYASPAALSDAVLSSASFVFLDIDFEAEEQNGMDIARRLRKVNQNALLFFVTNYIDYAPEGFEVRAFRYILKRDMPSVLERYMLQAMEQLADRREYLRLLDQDRVIDIPLKRIRYMEVMDHYVSIHTEKNSYILNTTLSNLEKELEGHGFLRVHKSYLVNMELIRKYRSRECVLTDETVLPVGEKSYAEQKQKYLRYKGTRL